MSDVQSEEHLVDDLAEEFARRWRNGERPSVEEYALRFPRWAADIRQMFPAVVMMEQLKPRPEAHPPVNPPAEDARPPEQLGDYQILREIGRGGMGVVYEAQHEALGRRVAVKVLPTHLFQNEKLRFRFRRESQAAARLHHTNIVPVFGVGEQNGQCYYVMQLISGRGLDRVIPTTLEGSGVGTAGQTAEAGQPPGVSSEETGVHSNPSVAPLREGSLGPLSHRGVALIGVQAAEALAYAHAQGVLHRDIKPSNLLLDEQGAVWVTDFGVAKLVEEAHLTQSGELVGTLRYMPPERFDGISDARGDVYGLGITLYELLARRPAFPDTTPHHLIQLINDGQLPALQTFDPTIPADLETIVLKASARDLAHRYQTAAELADDLRRFLEDHPIQARRVGPLELSWRWCRRNRVVATLAAVVFGLLVLTSVVALAAYFHTAAANQSITKALAAEQAEREHAERTSARALEALNRIYDRFAPNRILVTPALPAESAAEEAIELPPQPILSPEAVPLLEELLGFYEQLAQEGSEYPKLQAQAAEANQRIGDIHQKLGRFEQASAAYLKAIDLYQRPSAELLGGAVRIKIARTFNELGRALQALQRTDESRQAHDRALTALLEAPKDSATRPEYRYELARTDYFQARRDLLLGPPGSDANRPPDSEGRGRGGPRGSGRGDAGRRGRGGPDGRGPGGLGGPRPPGARETQLSQQALRLLQDLVNEYPAVPEYRHLLACCYRDLSVGPPRDGPGSFSANTSRAVEILRELVEDFPKVPDYRHDLCETLGRIPDLGWSRFATVFAANKQRLEEAITLSRALVAEYPNVPQYTASHAQLHDKLSFLFHGAGQTAPAEEELRNAVALQAGLVKQHPEVAAYTFSLAVMESSLARLHRERGDDSGARALLESSLKRLESLLKKDVRLGFVRIFLGRSYRELAQLVSRSGDKEMAAELLRKAEEFGPPRRRGER
jgi:serine/threonine protein kinase